MDRIGFMIRIKDKSKRMRKGDAMTIDCPSCGEFMQLYKTYDGRIRCRCARCGMGVEQ